MGTDKIFPDNWKEIIDGKKVVFYNTSVGSLLQGREKHIEKMRWVFQTFQEHPEVILWWRPHPLELSTMESMAPELVQQYLELRTQYVDKKTGILDESADVHRAIAISDAYYGDWSSLVQLYKVTGKPILIGVDQVRRFQPPVLYPGAFCVKDGFIWFLQLNSNALIKVNVNSFEVEDIVCIPYEKPYKRRQSNYFIADIENSIVMLLGGSTNIYEYEMSTGIVKTHNKIMDKKTIQVQPLELGNLYLLRHYGKENFIESDTGYSISDQGQFKCGDGNVNGCFDIVDNCFYIIKEYSNIICKYDFHENMCLELKVGEEGDKYWGIKKANDYFVMPHINQKAITLWNEKSGETIKLNKFPDTYKCLDHSVRETYLNMFAEEGNVYLFPSYANMILKINVNDKTIAKAFDVEFFDAVFELDAENFSSCMYSCAKRLGNYIYAYAMYQTCWHIFDLSHMAIWKSPVCRIEKEEHRKILEKIIDENSCDISDYFGECPLTTNLENYIKNVDRYCGNIQRKPFNNVCVGENIYRAVMSEV